MATIKTAADFIASPRFMELATAEAVSFLAGRAGVSEQRITGAIEAGNETVSRQVANLVRAAAEQSAEQVNANGWTA